MVVMHRSSSASEASFVAICPVTGGRCGGVAAISRRAGASPKIALPRRSHIQAIAPGPNVMAAPVEVTSSEKYTIPDGSTFWVIRLDREGAELPYHGTKDVFTLAHLKKLVKENDYSDVFLLAHGWNTTPLEDGSTDFSHNMVRALLANDTKKNPARKALYIAITWPSQPIKSLFVGTEGVRTNYRVNTEESRKLLANDPVKYWKKVQQSIEEDDPKAASKLGEITDSFKSGALGAEGQLPDDVASKVSEFGDLLGATDALKSTVFTPPEKVRRKVTPLDDPEDETEEARRLTIPMIAKAISATRAVARFFGFGGFAAVDDHVILLSRALEHVFFETFERRAATVGSDGVSQIIWELMSESAPQKTRFHLIGHSLGCHVMSSAAARGSPSAGDPEWVFPHKLHSLVLLQGAVPSMAYKKPGAYRVLAEGSPVVAGPVIATTSQSDYALQTYELFKGKPLGRYGFPDLGEKCLILDMVAGVRTKLGFQNGCFHTIDADPVIKIDGPGDGLQVVGAHSDIFDMELVSCFWEAAETEADDKDYEILRG
jgi:hypothetical protein